MIRLNNLHTATCGQILSNFKPKIAFLDFLGVPRSKIIKNEPQDYMFAVCFLVSPVASGPTWEQKPGDLHPTRHAYGMATLPNRSGVFMMVSARKLW